MPGVRSVPIAILVVLATFAPPAAGAASAAAPALTVSRLEKDVAPEAARDIVAGKLDAAFEKTAADRIKRRCSALWLRATIDRPP